jgi:hypothetical protein
VREQVVRQQDRLRVLQVGPARHRDPEVRVGLVHQGVDDVEDQPGQVARGIAQAHPQQRGDLVVAAAPGPQSPADICSGPLDEPSFQRGVHVFVVGLRSERPRVDVDEQLVQRPQHRRQVRVVEQTRAMQDPGVGLRPRDVVCREPPVEVGAAGQLGQRVGRATGETSAPEADPLGRLGCWGVVVRHTWPSCRHAASTWR